VDNIAVCTTQAADFLYVIGCVDTGFVVVEVTACSFFIFLEWWVTDDKILQPILNMFTYRIVEGNWEFFTPNLTS